MPWILCYEPILALVSHGGQDSAVLHKLLDSGKFPRTCRPRMLMHKSSAMLHLLCMDPEGKEQVIYSILRHSLVLLKICVLVLEKAKLRTLGAS